MRFCDLYELLTTHAINFQTIADLVVRYRLQDTMTYVSSALLELCGYLLAPEMAIYANGDTDYYIDKQGQRFEWKSSLYERLFLPYTKIEEIYAK